MRRTDTIRGLERGLRVLQVLQSNSISSLHDIHATTKISKPSLLRILNTLEQANMVSRRLADGCYRISAFTKVARKRDRHDRVVEAAGPVLDRLCQKVMWPSDLMVPGRDHMQRRETSQALTPFFIPTHSRQVGQAIGWLLTGVGRAYLAFCPEQEREELLRRLRMSDNPDDYLARDPKRLDQVLAETRRRGYGARDPFFTGYSHGGPRRDDGLAAIAVPLQDGARVHGSINILFMRTAFTVEAFAARHLGDLQAAAREIVSALHTPATMRNSSRKRS